MVLTYVIQTAILTNDSKQNTVNAFMAKEPKEMFSARLQQWLKDAIKAECIDQDVSESELIENWAFTNLQSSKARQILLDQTSRDWKLKAIVEAARTRRNSAAEFTSGMLNEDYKTKKGNRP